MSDAPVDGELPTPLNQQWTSQLRRGVLELVVLGALANKPQHGYELVVAFRGSSVLEVTEGTLYPLLRRLEKHELINATWRISATGPPRKVFTLSMLGQQVLSQMQNDWSMLNQAITEVLQAKQDEHNSQSRDTQAHQPLETRNQFNKGES
jgi:PadR family transcriptional regulator, regulatory protein PadR